MASSIPITIGLILIVFGLAQNIKMQWASDNFQDLDSWKTACFWKWGAHWQDHEQENKNENHIFSSRFMKIISHLNSFLYFVYVVSMSIGILSLLMGLILKIIGL